MRKVLPVVIVLAITAISCEEKTPTGPSRVEEITASPNTAPVVTIISPLQTSFSTDTPVTFTARANDEVAGLTDQIQWSSSIDGELGTGGTIIKVLSLGMHTILAKVADRGLEGSASLAVAVTAPGPPIVTIVEMPMVMTGTSVFFRGTAIDSEDGDISGGIRWDSSLDGNLGTGSLVTIPDGLSVGTHIVTAKSTDSDGLTGQAAVSIEVEAVPGGPGGGPNEPPVLTIVEPGPTERNVPVGRVVVFVGTAVDPEDGDISPSIEWRSSIDGPVGKGTGASVIEGFFSLGTHVITATVIDRGGVTVTAVINLTVGVPAPTRVVQAYTAPGAVAPAADALTLTFQLLDPGGTPTAGASPTYDVVGVWSAVGGDTGGISGSLVGLPDNGSLNVIFSRSATTVPPLPMGPCISTSMFSGQVTPTSIRLDRGAVLDLTCPWPAGFDIFDGAP